MKTLPVCPLCKSPLVKRSGKFGDFFGCSMFSKTHCKGSLSPYKYNALLETLNPVEKTENQENPTDPTQPEKTIIFSKYQTEILRIFTETTYNMIIRACAGSGKSFMLVQLAKRIPHDKKIIFIAFGKDLVKDLTPKIPEYCTLKTSHALGLSNFSRFMEHKKFIVNNNKLHDLLKVYMSENPTIVEEVKANESTIIKIVDLIKEYMLDTSMESISYISDKHTLVLNGNTSVMINSINWLYTTSLASLNQVDFTDMLYLCATGIVPCEQFDFILVDEVQDFNACQIALTEKSLKPGGRIIAVGDENQSIFAFRAADSEAMTKIENHFQCVNLPLSICYRCPQVVIDFINSEFPGIPFEGKPDNIKGIWETINLQKFEEIVRDGNLVLCRNNAPLVKYAYKLLSRGIKVTIKGREIGTNLINLIVKIEKKYKTTNLNDFLSSLSDYQITEGEKLEALGHTRKLETLNDQIEAIGEFAEGVNTTSEIINKILQIFSDDNLEGVIFSTVHKAKGLENETVFILQPSLMPSKSAKTEEDRRQEQNIRYVAYTRSKHYTYLVP